MLVVVPTETALSKPKPYLALLVQDSGGFVTPQFNFSRLPRIVLYSDGTMYTLSDVTTLQYPGAAVPTIRTKSAAGSVSRIFSAVYRTQLWNSKFNWGTPGVADVPNTDVTTKSSVRAKPQNVSIYALGITGPGLSKRQVVARKSAATLLNELQAFSNKYVYTKSVPTQWVSNRWAFQAREASYSDSFTNYHDWVGGTLNADVSCAVLSAQDSAELVALLPKINQATQFNSGGKAWDVTLRPLFPHETGCASLGYK